MVPLGGTRARVPLRATTLSLSLACCLALAACGATPDDRPTTSSPGVPPAPSATQSPTPRPSRTPPTPPLSDRPVIGPAPPAWLGGRVLPEQADGFGEIRPTPPELERRRFTLPDRLPPLP